MQYNEENIADTLLRNGKPQSPAILQGRNVTSYEALRKMTCDIGCALTKVSEKGECIGLISENSPFCVAAYLGTIHAGRVTVPLPGDISDQLLAHIVNSTKMKAAFVSGRYVKKHDPGLTKLGVQILDENILSTRNADVQMPTINPREDLASIMFTSGSTGTAKGVMVTHRNIECNSRDIIQYLDLTPSDRVMAVLPLHYCFGASLLHTHLMAGGSVVLNNQFMYPESVLDDMEKWECTGLAGVPSTYQILLRKTSLRQRNLPKLRWFQQAGGKLPNPFISEILESFSAARFFLMYGQTEATARLSYLPPERLTDKLGSIGKGLPSTRLEVLQKDGRPVCWGSDEIGEIVASGDNITKGYWADEAETAKFFRNGKLYTGDLARVDSDGFIFVQDRARDFIKTGGKRVGAKEVEDVICELKEIIEAAIIGVPHETMGEMLKAYLVVKSGTALEAEEVRHHVAGRLEAYKVPESVEFISHLPKNSAGKVLKPKLREINQAPA
ncbi:class I adenylate-forming enzyme family protein [Tichowtungia aerotolerans]|uniref:AMP-binding protein n=1 Tax=Tichowtungia aerotolerans TaxID=2697043 RepID=A0A6P1MB56_9BACT|nr:AMP-binding protein [Tichowtungia aerotolerans]QHI69774.1 AMP-binding protein [Tichowtungia aerotolerans]